MPTAAKLFAAAAFAVVAFFAAETFKPAMPDGTAFGFYSAVCALIGALCGWLVMGNLVGHGYMRAGGFGIRTSVTVLFFSVLVFSIYEMVQQSMKLRYNGPVDALQGMFMIALDYVKMMGRPDFLIVLLVGGYLGGMFAEWADERWS